MSNELTKKAAEMLLSGATLLSEPCPYCKGVRVMKDGNALCVNCGKKPDSDNEKEALKTNAEANSTALSKLEKKLDNLEAGIKDLSDNIDDMKSRMRLLKKQK